MSIRKIGITRKGFIILMMLMLILSFNLNKRINDPSLNQESFKLRLSDVPIVFGETINGYIDYAGEIDNYTFTANAADTVLIRMSKVSGVAFDPEIRLYSPTGVELSRDWDYNKAELSYNLPQDGLYTVSACDHQELDMGTYCIYTQRVNNPGNTIPIEFGNTTSGFIELHSEMDTYTFSANVGDSVVIRMCKSSGDSFSHQIRLYSPSGVELSQSSGTTNVAEIFYMLNVNGQYTVLACDSSGVNAGAYCLFVQRVNNPGNPIGTEFGETTSGSINSPSEAKTYTFSASATDAILVRISKVSGAVFNPELRLYGPNGMELAKTFNIYADTIELSYTLPENGVYTVLACEYSGNDIGSYNIFIQKLNNPRNALPIEFGNTTSGFIELHSEMDTYTFSANVGDSVVIRMCKSSGDSFSHQIRLYSPSGVELSQSSGTTNVAEIFYMLNVNGQYTVLACDSSGVNAGAYCLFVQRVNNPGAPIMSEFDKTVFGSIGFPSEGKTYIFSASASDDIFINITKISGVGFNPELRLYGPNGMELARSYNLNVDTIELSYVLPENGVYTVLACEYHGKDIGSYNMFFKWLYQSVTSVINLTVPYIHQCWDTPDDFDGRWACGATCAVMVLAYYGIISQWPCDCSLPYPHTSNYGNYISKEYTYGSYTFDTMTLDASGSPSYGAYGYIHYSDGLSKLGRMVDYFKMHGLDSWQKYGPSELEIKAELEAGHPVPASTKLTEIGHWIIIVGYTDEGYYIVHDPFGSKPYGNNPGGNYNGSYVLYTWDEMKINEKWAAFVHLTEEHYLFVEIIDQLFSIESFDIKFLIYDDNDMKIDSANIEMWWDGNDVSSSVQNLGGGTYSVSLEPITVAPGENPILLNMIISAVGRLDKYFEIYIAVDPDSIDKGKPSDGEPTSPAIPGYNIFFLIFAICLISKYKYFKHK